jgi:flagellar biosynthesis protein FlhG
MSIKVISVASGKGGVGKSLVSANLAVALAQAGKKVILADLDLGGSNLHLLIGQNGTRGIGTFLNNDTTRLEDVILPTAWPNLGFLAGETELPGAANLHSQQKKKLIKNLLKLDGDYLIMDLGAGTNFNIMDLFLLSGCGIIVTMPTLTATLNAYLFVKNAVFRILNSCIETRSPAHEYMESLRRDGFSLQKIHVTKLLDNIKRIDEGAWRAFSEKVAHLRPRLIMNMVEDPSDVVKSKRLRVSTRDYLGVELEHLGVVYRDEYQQKAQQSQLPIIIYKPQSVLSQAIYRIADKVLEMDYDDSGPLSSMDVETGFQEAEVEAESDFNSKMGSLEELLESGVLSQGDLVETIRTQQMEIDALKKENRFLKAKIVKAAEAGYKL